MGAISPIPESPLTDFTGLQLAAGHGPRQRWNRLPQPGGWLRFEQGPLNADQVLKNLETGVSVLQRVLVSLEKLDGILNEAMLGVNASWAGGDRCHKPPCEMADFLARRLGMIDEIVKQCRFHGRGLINGQSGVTGMGVGVLFIRGGPQTMSSPPQGYEVNFSQIPSRAAITGGVSVHEEWLSAEKEIFLAEGENFIRFSPEPRETVQGFLDRLRERVFAAGLDLDIGLTRQQRLMVRHNQYGSQFKFKGMSLNTPLLSKRPGKIEWSHRGRDVQGTLTGEPAFGIGRMLIGYLDNPRTSELAVMWQGTRLPARQPPRVHVMQNGLIFPDGLKHEGSMASISLPSFHTGHIGNWLDTSSGAENLAELRGRTWRELKDALHMLFAVSCELDDWKARIETWVQRYQGKAMVLLSKSQPVIKLPAVNQVSGEAEKMAEMLRSMMRDGN